MVKRLELDFGKLKGSAVTKDLILTEDYIDVMKHVFNKAKENKYKEKIEIFSAILVSSSQRQEVLEDEFNHIYIEIVAGLNIYEIKVLQHLYSFHKGLERKKAKEGEDAEIDFKIDFAGEYVLDVPRKYFKSTFDSLISKGLANDDGIGD